MKRKENDVIISGVSGRFPKSDNVEEFWQNLFIGKPLYGPDTFPYPKIFSRLPKSRGYLKDTRLFDHTFFSYTVKESNSLDPQIRILLEVVYEALWDAGIRPDEWRGTRTGFFLGSAFDDTGLSVRWDYKLDLPQFFAQRISYHYDWKGPTMIVDTACAASLNALHTAYWSIEKGECDQAVVAGISVHVKPSITVCFGELEMLSKSGVSWCLDERADGYIRSEAVVAVVLQKDISAKRIYASILNSCTSSDGYTKEGITFPKREIQVETMRRTMKQSGISPLDVNYVEAHITGTSAGDPIEALAIMEAYRANSDRPLMLGCLKSNIGHSEASAGLCALTKAIKIFQTQLIPPNINMVHCNPRIESLREGRLRPVVKPTIFTDQIISIDAFGFGGSNTHVILKGPRDMSPSQKLNSPLAIPDKVPRLIFICNRTKKGISKIVETVKRKANKLPNGYLSLLTNLGYSKPETGLHHRAFCLIDSSQRIISKSSELVNLQPKPLCLLLDDTINSSVDDSTGHLLILTDFRKKAKKFLKQNTSLGDNNGYANSASSNSHLDAKLNLVIQQMTYVFFLRLLNVSPELIIGIGIGKIAAQYAANQLSWEDALTLAVNFKEKQFDAKNDLGSSLASHRNEYLQDLVKWIAHNHLLNSNFENNFKFSNSLGPKADYYLHKNLKSHNLKKSSKLSDWTMVKINSDLIAFDLDKMPTMQTSIQSNLESLLISIGNIYLSGHDPLIDILYPVSYPVEYDCPSIGHLLDWKHDLHFDNMIYPEFFRNSFRTAHRIDLLDSDFSDLSDYLVDGQVTLPIAGYIWMIWDHLVKMRCTDQHVRYHSFQLWSTEIHKLVIVKDPVEFRVASNPVNNQFVVKLGEDLCATGYAKIVDDNPFDYDLVLPDLSINSLADPLILQSDEFYTEMSIRGLTIKPKCRTVNQVTLDGSLAKIMFNGNWIVFIESCLTIPLLGNLGRCLETVSSLEWFRCDPVILNGQFKMKKKLKDDLGVDLIYNSNLQLYTTHGLAFKTPVYKTVSRSLDMSNLHHRYQTWFPYFGQLPLNQDDWLSERAYYIDEIDKLLTVLDNPQDRPNFPTLKGPNDILLNLLWESYKRPSSRDYLRHQVTTNRAKLNQDRLIYHLQTNLLVQHLAIFEENVKQNGMVNITSFGSTGYPFRDTCYNHFRRIRNRYSFTSDSESTTIKPCDLLIYNHESMALLPSENDERSVQQLRECLSSMPPSSFVLIQIRDSLLPLEDRLADYMEIKMMRPALENVDKFKNILSEQNFIFVSEYTILDGQMYSLLARKKFQLSPEKQIHYLRIKDRSYQWINDLQKLVEDQNNQRIWLMSDETYRSGIIGLVNSLKEERFGDRIKCLFSSDCKLDLDSDVCEDLMAKDLVINVLINQVWGSFRHFDLSNESAFVNSKQVYLEQIVRPSKNRENKLTWCKLSSSSVDYIVNHYAPMDFNISPRSNLGRTLDVNHKGVGTEFVGLNKKGAKVMGLCTNQGVSNIIETSQIIFTLPVPTHWSLKNASTVILPYTIAYYSLIVRGFLRPKSTVLLHNLTGGLCEASISICNSLGCHVLIYHRNLTHATRNELINSIGIKSEQLLSAEVDLEEQIASLNECQGMDYIFTMDSIDQLASISNCISTNGKLINLILNENLDKHYYEATWLPENASFESICWPRILKAWADKSESNLVNHLNCVLNYFRTGLVNGQVKPIIRSLVFRRHDLSKAINQLSTFHQQPLGRVIIQMIDDDELESNKQSIDCLHSVRCEARTQFSKGKCYIIFGGLGGVGLQLSHWIVEHGGRKIVLVSRNGISKNYQRYMIHRMINWPDKMNPVTVETIDLPVVGYSQVLSLIEKVQSSMGIIGGVFNLAGALSSGLFENQTVDSFNLVCSSKVELTEHLDAITRSKCSSSLDYFVCFSSIGSTGILGESNYCYANSFMERICEQRRSSGYPACAIQYGAIGDVGMAADNSLTIIAGSTAQPMFSCLQTLDKMLQLDYPVVYSAISAEKSDPSDDSKGSFIQRIEHILGLQNLDSLDESTTLSDLGLDSLQSIEVKDLIDKTYSLSLQNIAIGKLSVGSLLRFKEEFQDQLTGNGKDRSKFTEEVIINLTEKGTSPIFFFPPALFDFLSMKALAEALQRTVFGIDLTEEVRQIGNLHKIAEFYCNKILERFPDEKRYYFVGYSYGCLISFEVAKVLQRVVGRSRLGCLCFIDATPYGLKRLGQITSKAALLGLPGSEVFCIAMDHLGVHIDQATRENLLEAEDDDEKYMELVSELMASAGMNGPAEGLLSNPVANIDRGYYLTHMDDLGQFDGDALFIRVLSKQNHGKPSTVCEGLSKIITGKIKEVLYNASHFDVLKVYAKEIARDIEEMMPPNI